MAKRSLAFRFAPPTSLWAFASPRTARVPAQQFWLPDFLFNGVAGNSPGQGPRFALGPEFTA